MSSVSGEREVTRVKICGVTEADDARFAATAIFAGLGLWVAIQGLPG